MTRKKLSVEKYDLYKRLGLPDRAIFNEYGLKKEDCKKIKEAWKLRKRK